MVKFEFASTRGYNIGEEIEYKGYRTTIVAFYESGFVVINKPGYSTNPWHDEIIDRKNNLVNEYYTYRKDWSVIMHILDNICGTCKNSCKDKDVETCPFYEKRNG